MIKIRSVNHFFTGGNDGNGPKAALPKWLTLSDGKPPGWQGDAGRTYNLKK